MKMFHKETTKFGAAVSAYVCLSLCVCCRCFISNVHLLLHLSAWPHLHCNSCIISVNETIMVGKCHLSPISEIYCWRENELWWSAMNYHYFGARQHTPTIVPVKLTFCLNSFAGSRHHVTATSQISQWHGLTHTRAFFGLIHCRIVRINFVATEATASIAVVLCVWNGEKKWQLTLGQLPYKLNFRKKKEKSKTANHTHTEIPIS